MGRAATAVEQFDAPARPANTGYARRRGTGQRAKPPARQCRGRHGGGGGRTQQQCCHPGHLGGKLEPSPLGQRPRADLADDCSETAAEPLLERPQRVSVGARANTDHVLWREPESFKARRVESAGIQRPRTLAPQHHAVGTIFRLPGGEPACQHRRKPHAGTRILSDHLVQCTSW